MEHRQWNRRYSNNIIQCNICLQRNRRLNLYFTLDDIEQPMYGIHG